MHAKYKGSTIEFDLGQYGYNQYLIECTYRYDKKVEKYALEMELKHKDIGDGFRIDRQEIDTQYIVGTRDTIKNNIERIVEYAALSNFFDEYIKRYEYTLRCFEKGNELYELEWLKAEENNKSNLGDL